MAQRLFAEAAANPSSWPSSPLSYRPGDQEGLLDVTVEKLGWVETMAEALDLEEVRVIPTGDDEFQQEREQWDDGDNVVALEPAWWWALHDLPRPPRPGLRLNFSRSVAPTRRFPQDLAAHKHVSQHCRHRDG